MSELCLSREVVRDVDRRAIEEFGMIGLVLMENAGCGSAKRLESLGIQGLVVVCCGKGNNGGDGFVIARHLEAAGHAVRVILVADPAELTGDARTNWKILEAAETPRLVWNANDSLAELEHHLAEAEWIVDALLGTGAVGVVREPYRSAIRAMRRTARRVLAVDLPSGLGCDTGLPLSVDEEGRPICVEAQHTVTFVATKHGFRNPASRIFTGEVHVVPIGVPRRLLESITPS